MKTKLVHVRLEPDRIIVLCAEAKRRGISVDELVQQAVTEFLREKRGACA
jgi:predicted HicB family RNase H-like nuclease